MRSVILGSVAGLLAVGGAQAADLPVKAKAVEYVRICSLYGAGFFYVPGSDTCIKLGGYLRADTTFNGGVYDAPGWASDIGARDRYRYDFFARSRMAFTIDTRTATEYGVVRTFGQADFQFSTLGTSANPTAINTNLGNNPQLGDTPGGGYTAVEMVFLQFAGFTFGKSGSAYATPWHGFVGGQNTASLLGGHDTVTGVNNIQYSSQFGNGMSATIGLDDPAAFNRTSIYNLSTGLNSVGVGGTALGGSAYGGTLLPDLVGNVRIDQAWGLFQLSGALHTVNASYNTLTAGTNVSTPLSELSGHPDTKEGGSVMAALQIKNIPTGAGDDIKVDASWAKGDTKNVISTSTPSPNFAMFSGADRTGVFQSVGFGVATDALYLPVTSGGDGSLHLTSALGFRGGFNHNWDPYWSSSLFGSYSMVRYDATARAAYCGVYSASTGGLATKSADYSCNPNYNASQLGLVTRWTPVKNLTFSTEVMWFHLDQKFTGTSILAAAAPLPTTTYQFKDQDTVSLNVRVQRNF